MTAKFFLLEIGDIENRIKLKNKMLEKYINLQAPSDVSSSCYDNLGIKSNSFVSAETASCYIVNLRDEILTLKMELSKRIEMIDSLANRFFSLILSYRYIMHYNWRQISEVLGYSIPYLFKVHKKALVFFYTKFKIEIG